MAQLALTSAVALALASPLPAAAQQNPAGATSNGRVGQPPMNSAMRRANAGVTGPQTGSAASATSSTPTNAMTLTSSNGAPSAGTLGSGAMNQRPSGSGSGRMGMRQNNVPSGTSQQSGYDSNGIMRRNGSPSGG